MAEFDLVALGATGFTGQQVARYLAEHAPSGMRWALAGRDRKKLDQLAKATGAHGVVSADCEDPASIGAMVPRASVVLSTAGPFAKYGTPVVEACVRHGVDYVDITGETPWVRDMIDRYHAEAAARGVRVVPFCGSDSVPSDLGAAMMVEHFRKAGSGTRRVTASFRMKGGLNGGTLATMLTMAERGQLERLADPFLLNPEGAPAGADRKESEDVSSVRWDEERGLWLAPFIMAPINTRVVRRSAALQAAYGAPYGEHFSYNEAMETRRRRRAWALAGGYRAAWALLSRSWGRLLARRYGPAPGQGPAPEVIEKGFLHASFVATSDAGDRAVGSWDFRGDPGNRFTVTAACESALALACERDRLPGGIARGGVLTPATALGDVLIERLRRVGVVADVQAA